MEIQNSKFRDPEFRFCVSAFRFNKWVGGYYWRGHAHVNIILKCTVCTITATSRTRSPSYLFISWGGTDLKLKRNKFVETFFSSQQICYAEQICFVLSFIWYRLLRYFLYFERRHRPFYHTQTSQHNTAHDTTHLDQFIDSAPILPRAITLEQLHRSRSFDSRWRDRDV